MSDQIPQEYVLGIDLGSNSLGWAIIGLIDGEPAQLVRAGARVFEAGMEGDLESGHEESRNLKRRQMRLQRRQAWRRARRLKKIFNLLQGYGLLPAGDTSTPEKRQDLTNELDKTIRASDWFKTKAASGKFPEPEQTLPYILRAAALDEPLEPYFLGRALYHLAQRRGFLSNRKQVAKKKDDDEGVVKKDIGELRGKIEAISCRTLGEYFSRLGPSVGSEEHKIRRWHTHRDMFKDEFEKIWAAQAQHHSNLLTPDRKKKLYNAIFFQRPLWFDRNTIGRCELESGHQRAPAYLQVSQRFRLLQTVNNLRVLPPDDVDMPLTPTDRAKLIEELETEGDRTFKQVSKLLKLEKDYKFNLETGGEKTLKGNRTNADFYAAFGERWLAMSPEERDRAVEYVHSFQKPEKLKHAARFKWGLDEEQAEKLAGISLEPDYLNLSRRAIEKLLPLMEKGFPYGMIAPRYAAISPEVTQKLLQAAEDGMPFRDVCKSLLGDPLVTSKEHSSLPPVERALAEIRNPAVTRSLTELRKVVNAITRQQGRPTYVHVELARDLKKSKKQRQAISENNRRNERARAEAAKEIIAEAGIKEPKPDDIRRFLLAEECHWMCPYTGKAISARSLFGPEPQFDIEHIIPFSRSMDNYFQNLTLCYEAENRSVKGNKTPWQAYHGNVEQYEAIVDRVKKFSGDRQTVAAKLKRFTMNDDELEGFLEDFRNRQLNDTAYATSTAAKYLGLLYGGVIGPDGRRRVQATSGQATAYFRSLWKLNSILNDGTSRDGGTVPKSRDDHRHHAVDAVVIGLTDAAMIKRLSDAAQRAPLEHRRRFASLEAPWPNFVDSVRSEIDKIVVSHRVSKKVSGALHEETIYSPPIGGDGEVRVRKPLTSLTKQEVEKIADAGVRKLVQQKLEELGGIEPKKAFANPENLPRFPSSGVVIKNARISKAVPTFTLGEGRAARRVTSESNHHVEMVTLTDEKRKQVEWDGRVVPMKDAYKRLRTGLAVIDKTCQVGEEYRFSLCPGEVLECHRNGDVPELLVFKGVSQYTAGAVVISLLPLNDARKNPKLIRVVPNRLRQWHARKVVVSPIGEVTEAHD